MAEKKKVFKKDSALFKKARKAEKKGEKKAEKLFKKAEKIKKSNEKKENKIAKVMREYKEDKLHSGSKKGPKVKSRKQAVAIALSEARKKRK